MNKYIVLLGVMLSVLLANAQSLKRNNFAWVLIYHNQKKINIYDTCYKSKKIINYILNDTVNEDYFVIRVIKKENDLYKVVATSILHPGIKGWITLDNIGINIRQRKSKLLLYKKPSYKAKYIVVNEEVDNRMVRVIAISSNWLKIMWIDNHDYWLSPRYQCPNPYTTCN